MVVQSFHPSEQHPVRWRGTDIHLPEQLLQLVALALHQSPSTHVWYPVWRWVQQTVPLPPSEVGLEVGEGVTAWVGGAVGFFVGRFDGVELGCFEGDFVGF